MGSAESSTAATARAAAGALVVTIDRLPAWILPAYGSTWVATPALDGLAASGLVFDRLFATTTVAGATLAALAAGGGLAEVASRLADGLVVITDDDSALAPALAAAGRVTVVPLPRRRRVAASVEETALGCLAAAATTALRSVARGCVWCHATSLGRVWDAPEGFRDAFVDPDDPPPPAGAEVPAFAVTAATDPDDLVGIRQLFAGQVSLLDHCLANLLAAVPPDWAVLVCGIRGMALGLHGAVGPREIETPDGGIVHLPAILRAPAVADAAQRERGLVIPADLGATLAALLGGPSSLPGTPWLGHDLGSMLAGDAPPPRDRVVVAGPGGGAVVTDAWSMHVARTTDSGIPAARRLYAQPDDFFRICDVADRSPQVAEELAALVSSVGEGVVDGADEAAADAWLRPLSPAAREPAT
ncbi:MAG: hypothetical protein FJ309_13395 [Planctomycetes bacterium]|nr:hypothetical protein [Planctomycetota bacterium]